MKEKTQLSKSLAKTVKIFNFFSNGIKTKKPTEKDSCRLTISERAISE